MSTATLADAFAPTIDSDNDWRAEASCATRQHQFLFIHPLHDYDRTDESRLRNPFSGELMSHQEMEEAKASIQEEAKKVCRACPVIDSCLAFSLKEEVSGIAGGLTERQRTLMRKKEGIDLNQHDTDDYTGNNWTGNSLNDARIYELSVAGLSAAEIAKEVGCQKRSVYRVRARIRDLQA